MRCPFCQHPDTQVVDSRTPEDGSTIRRRRRCLSCQKRFTTFEHVHLLMPTILKSHQRREPYQRDKVVASMTLACRKRPVSPESIETAVVSIETQLMTEGNREVPASHIGELVLAELAKLDEIAYIRFASVYFNIDDPEKFITMIKKAVRQAKQKGHEA